MPRHTFGGVLTLRSAPLFDTLEPRLLMALVNGVDPHNLGKGDWIWQIASARASAGASTNVQLFQYLKNKGMSWVTVKAGDGSTAWTQFSTQLVGEIVDGGGIGKEQVAEERHLSRLSGQIESRATVEAQFDQQFGTVGLRPDEQAQAVQ